MNKPPLKELLGRVPSLDGMRAISILMVVSSHASVTCNVNNPTWIPKWTGWLFSGDLGVRIFFVISGFIITLLLLKEEEVSLRISLVEFYRRRAIRILPPYLAVIVTVFLMNIMLGLGIGKRDFISALTFSTGWWRHPTWILAHSWSLSVEEQFYLLWPLTLILVKGKFSRYGLLIFALVIFPLMRVAVYKSSLIDLRPYIIVTQGDSILCGCGLAMLLFHHGEVMKRLMTINVTATSILSLAAIFIVRGFEANAIHGPFTVPFANTIYSIAIAWLIGVVILNRGLIYSVLNSRPLIFIGTVSYSWYLWQQLFLVRCGRYDNWEGLAFPINLFVSFVVGVASYYLIERGSKRLRNV